MSHTVKIEVKYKVAELPILFKAFTNLGWTVVHEAQAREYGGRRKSYAHVAVNPGTESTSYDIGMTEVAGNVELYSDFYGGSIVSSLGADLRKLKQEFAACVVEDEFQNATVTRTVGADGNLLIEVEQW